MLTCHVLCSILLSSSISSLHLLPVLSCVNLALYRQKACVCGCLCVHVYVLRIVSMDKILGFTNTLIYLTQGYRATKCHLWSLCTRNVVCWTPVHIDGIKMTWNKTTRVENCEHKSNLGYIFCFRSSVCKTSCQNIFLCPKKWDGRHCLGLLVLTQMLMHVIAQGDCADTARLRVLHWKLTL